MKTEIITLVIVLVLLYTRPSALVRFSNTLLGKVLFVGAVIIASLVNPLAGLFFATLMIILMEQSYEGFKEGNTGSSTPTPLPWDDVTPVGSYVTGATLITIDPKNQSRKSIDITFKESEIIDNTTSEIFAEHTIINSATDTTSIKLKPSETDKVIISGDIANGSNVNILTSETAFDTDSVSKSNTTNYDIDITNSDTLDVGDFILFETNDTKKYVKTIETLNGNTSLYNIKLADMANMTMGNIKLNSFKKATIKEVTIDAKDYTDSDIFTILKDDSIVDTDKFVDPTNSEVKAISEVKNTINLNLNVGITGDITSPPSTIFTIKDHSHTHKHTENFVGGRKEGFFTGDEKKETAVKGAYAEETYEDEIIGETVCSSDLCDRIDSEFNLIRPINSNDHTPTNV